MQMTRKVFRVLNSVLVILYRSRNYVYVKLFANTEKSLLYTNK